MASSQQTLLELFQEYSANNDDGAWLERYKSVAEHMDAIRRGEQELTDNFLEQLWTKQHYGAASLPKSTFSKEKFLQYEKQCRKVTKMLVTDSREESLGKAYKIFQDEAKSTKTPRALIHRIAMTSAPKVYSNFPISEFLRILKKWLEKVCGLKILAGGSWESLSISLRKEVISQGIPDDDPFLVNTFTWYLYTEYARPWHKSEDGSVEDNDESDDNDASAVCTTKPVALNTIYYGPPGTGKTYLVRKMLKENFESHYADVSREEWLADLVRDAKWRDVVAASLADLKKADRPGLMKHPLLIAKYACMGGKEQTGRRVNNSLRAHAPADWPTLQYAQKGTSPVLFGHESGGVWHLLEDWEERSPDAAALFQKYKAGKPSDSIKKERYKCITFHQSYSYEDFVEGIRPVLQNEEQDEPDEQGGSLGYSLHDGVFKRICDEARSDPAHDYALLIDEINRGNISKIFGELITLIEDSKREGAAEEIKVTLPYSGEPFCIPKNLYIIGTMNTADRSLALLDTALRRRFDFHRVDPAPGLLGDKVIDGVELGRLLKVLNERIAALYDQDHMIGHSYFLKVKNLADLKNVFLKNIFPLLEEYFFDDWEKIRLVLGDTQKYRQDKKQFCLLFKEERKADLFGDAVEGFSLLPRWTYIEEALDNRDSYIGIYDLNKLTR